MGPNDEDNTTSVILDDLDGDGDLDIIAGNDGQRNKLYLNNGTSAPFGDAVSGLPIGVAYMGQHQSCGCRRYRWQRPTGYDRLVTVILPRTKFT